jgi:hypothetical protein
METKRKWTRLKLVFGAPFSSHIPNVRGLRTVAGNLLVASMPLEEPLAGAAAEEGFGWIQSGVAKECLMLGKARSARRNPSKQFSMWIREPAHETITGQ